LCPKTCADLYIDDQKYREANVRLLNQEKVLHQRPRGVSLTNRIFYNLSLEFTCLDSSKTISFNFVNDDYCDCADGSDEPGTSACFNGIFFCLNSGLKPKNILSSRVNDGICDCCDGSDEWKNQSLCPKTCGDLYINDQKQPEVNVRLLNQEKAQREKFSKTGKAIQQSREKKLHEAEEKLNTILEYLNQAKALREKLSKAGKPPKQSREKQLQEKLTATLEKKVKNQREKEIIETKDQNLKIKKEAAELESIEILNKQTLVFTSLSYIVCFIFAIICFLVLKVGRINFYRNKKSKYLSLIFR